MPALHLREAALWLDPWEQFHLGGRSKAAPQHLVERVFTVRRCGPVQHQPPPVHPRRTPFPLPHCVGTHQDLPSELFLQHL